jgi:GNAT superfamily N-acetyltransferase
MPMSALLTIATPADAADVAALRNAAASRLTALYGTGHWSSLSTERGVVASLKQSSIYVVRDSGGDAVATLQLGTRKPFSIDPRHFTSVPRPLYLVGMAVGPRWQRCGIGRRCIAEALEICSGWPADALRLDAYDSDAGAGDFYRRCGFAEAARTAYKGRPLIYFERLV